MKSAEAERILGLVGGEYTLRQDKVGRFYIDEAVEEQEIRQWAVNASNRGYALNMVSNKGGNPTIFIFIEYESDKEPVRFKEKSIMENNQTMEELENRISELRALGEDDNAEEIEKLEIELASLAGLEDEGIEGEDGDEVAQAIRDAQASKKSRKGKKPRAAKKEKAAKAAAVSTDGTVTDDGTEEVVVSRGGRRGNNGPRMIKADPATAKKNIRTNIRAMVETIEQSEAAEPMTTRVLQMEDTDITATIKLTGAEVDGKLTIAFTLNEEEPVSDQYKFYEALYTYFLGDNS